MAEEKIMIIKANPRGLFFGEDVIQHEFFRQEAIERMAKAYCSLMWGDRYSWEEVPDENKKYFYNFATVGLNALLEGK